MRRQNHPAVVEVTPGYDSFLVEYDPLRLRTDDLHRLIAQACDTPVEVVRCQHAPDYRVYCLGFSPGFPYLGDLDPTLATPRLASSLPKARDKGEAPRCVQITRTGGPGI